MFSAEGKPRQGGFFGVLGRVLSFQPFRRLPITIEGTVFQARWPFVLECSLTAALVVSLSGCPNSNGPLPVAGKTNKTTTGLPAEKDGAKAEVPKPATTSSAPATVASTEIETILRSTMPKFSSDIENQPIFRALSALAKAQGLEPKDFTTYRTRSGFSMFSGGAYSRKIKGDSAQLVLVVQTVQPLSMPGTSAVQLVLLDMEGKILDRLQCEINSRYGIIVPEIRENPDSDGSQAVLRFQGDGFAGKTSLWHNWHAIQYRGRTYMFSDSAQAHDPAWTTEGLCRVAVQKNGFSVRFPRLWPNPGGSELELRVAPKAIEDPARALRELETSGPAYPANTYVGGDYAWLEFSNGQRHSAFVGSYRGVRYMLVHTAAPYLKAVLYCRSSSPKGKAWGLKSVKAVQNGAMSAVECVLDEEGARLLAALAKAHDGETLAIVVDRKVVATTVLRPSGPSDRLRMEDGLTSTAAQNLATALQAGMVEALSPGNEPKGADADRGEDAARKTAR